MNYVVLSGICREVSQSSMILEVEGTGNIRLYFDDAVNIELIELNAQTKIEGKITQREFPFPTIQISKVYQIKKMCN